MSGHTPGPWRVFERVSIIAEPDPTDDVLPVIAQAIKHGDDAELDSNTRLIAAAPLMLEALQNLENDDGTTMPASAWNLVLDAIEAATGERPNK